MLCIYHVDLPYENKADARIKAELDQVMQQNHDTMVVQLLNRMGIDKTDGNTENYLKHRFIKKATHSCNSYFAHFFLKNFYLKT